MLLMVGLRNLIVLLVVFIIISPVLGIYYINNSNSSKFVVTVVCILLLAIVMNSMYGDSISTKLDIMMAQLSNRIHNTQNRIRVIDLL